VLFYVDSFRGKPILPQDFVSVGAAADVASQYDWSITVPVCLTLLLLVALIVFWSKCNVRLRPRFRIISLLLSGLLLWYCKEEIIDRNRNNVVFSWWSPEKTFSENGYFLSFVHALQYLFPQLPEGYTEEYVQSLMDCSTADNSVTNQTNLIDVLPKNIIVIMEESWSDFHIYNNLKTDAPTTPVKDTLSGPTALTGNTHVSVYGGNTVNTEYEFLTGNTVAELPGEAIAYSLYMYEGMPSMVSCLSDLGYTTISYHPGSETTYNRKNVYRYLGFDNSYWEDSFYDNSYVRSLVSDESDFQHLIELCENSDSDRNFIFNVTIQNHASYDPSTINTTIHTISPHIATLDAYLSLVQLSDKAIGKLIDYFAKSEDKTVLLIFGDHQPAFSSSVYDAIGYSANENMFDSRFVTSAILWANYELPGALPNLDKVSVNFLASLLLKSIGVNLKGYPEFLQKLHLEYPVVSSAGCIDSQGEFNSYSKAIESSRVLQDYAILQYNYIFDKDNKIDNYFWDCQS